MYAMMLIAFITIQSSSVPLIEGLCTQTNFRFEISVVLLTSSSFLFCERKNLFKGEKKSVSPDFYPQSSINICMCTSYTARYICTLSLQYIRVWISSGLSRCLVPTPGLTSEYPTCSVCACACSHTHNKFTSTPCKK